MDARFPERWLSDRRIMRLSSSAFRSFVCALAWSVSNRTDGEIDSDDVALIPGLVPVDVAELLSAGLLDALDGGWQIVDFGATQTSADEVARLERIRAAERRKKAAQREKKRLEELADVPGTRPPGHHRLGQASKKEEEPPRFCDDHPRGTRERCGECARARDLHETWKALRPTSSGIVTQDADPTTCEHRNGAGRSTIAAGACSLCGTRVGLEVMPA